MNRRSHVARHRSRTAASLLPGLLAALATALPAAAAELREVRVGAHGDFTRVVFELDRSAGYRVEKAGTPSRPELRVTLDATASGSHEVGAHGDVRGVKVAPGPRAVAAIPLRRSGLRLQEMILSNPPRIVLDLKRPAPVAAKSGGTAARAEKPAPSPKAETAAAPKPEPRAASKPAPAPEPLAKAPAPSAEPKAEAKSQPAPEPKAPESAPEAAAAPEPDRAAKPAPAAPTPLAQPADPFPGTKSGARTPLARPAPKDPMAGAKPAPVAKSRPEAQAAPEAEPGWLQELAGDPLILGAAAGGLVALVGIAITLRRRSRVLPGDLDAAAIAAELDGDDADPAENAARPKDGESPFADLFDAAAQPSGPPAPPIDEPAGAFAASELGAQDPSEPGSERPPAVAGPEFDVEAPADPSTAPDSIFAEASQGEAPMNQDMDLPADRSSLDAPPPPAMGASAMGGASPDVAQMLEAFERRIQGLEQKLEEANEAREKLERQVAAQSEELRVQRAAIARTQRALRTMSRGDEDKATEPALREGETQAKTRVNV